MRKLYVSNKDESVRLFKNGFLELFTKVHFSIPLFTYLPVIGYFIYLSALQPEISWVMISLLFFGGVFAWTFAEYFLHRYVFHYHPTSDWGQRIHFLMHGVHHDYPNDSKRLVMPPSVRSMTALVPRHARKARTSNMPSRHRAMWSGWTMWCFSRMRPTATTR